MQASSARISWTTFLVIPSMCIFLTALPLWIGSAQICCAPDILPPESYRFPQGAQVTVYIDMTSGFTSTEAANIMVGIEDWNSQVNSSEVRYSVQTTETPPILGENTPNTIVVSYVDETPTTHDASYVMFKEGNSIFGRMAFSRNMRLIPSQLRESYWRTVARHETGHTLGLKNGDNCPEGTTIMNHEGAHVESFITTCDNVAINSQAAYPAPSPTPTPTPEENGQFDCNDNIDNDGDGLIDCQDTCSHWCINGCNAYLTQLCWDLGAPQCVNGQCYTPILVDVLGDGLKLTNASNGVLFNVLPGRLLKIAWTEPTSDDAWLVLDRNGNGVVDSGEEMFGNATP